MRGLASALPCLVPDMGGCPASTLGLCPDVDEEPCPAVNLSQRDCLWSALEVLVGPWLCCRGRGPAGQEPEVLFPLAHLGEGRGRWIGGAGAFKS